MKILFIISEQHFGLTSLLVGQAIAFNRIIDLDFTFVSGTNEKEPGLFQKLEDHGIKVIKIQDLEFNKNFIRNAIELDKIIDNLNPDFIHVQTNWQLTLTGFLKIIKRKNIKIIYTIHAFRHNSNLIKSSLARAIIGLALFVIADKIIACSTYTFRKFKILNYKMSILYLGIDDRFFNKIYDIGYNIFEPIKIIFSGDFRIGKNQELLIRTIAKCLSAYPFENITLTLPGNGPLKSKCIELSHTLKVSENIIFPGFLSKEEIINEINLNTISIIPTNSETFGLCIAETFSSGLCVITRNVGIASDIIVNGENGYIFNSDNELFPILEKLVNNKVLIRQIGRNAFSKRDVFSWSLISGHYFDLINKK
jgi:glycosyltransferase involved in cell wall biosynthesis